MTPGRRVLALICRGGGLFARIYLGVVLALVVGIIAVSWLAATQQQSRNVTSGRAEDESAEYERLTRGFAWLMRRELLDHSPERRESVLRRWQANFAYPLSLRAKSDLLDTPLPTRVRNRLLADKAAAGHKLTSVASGRLSLFLPLPDADQVLVQEVELGPGLIKAVTAGMGEVAVLLAVVAFAVLALTYPFYRHTREVAKTANAFGVGEFEVRANEAVPEPIRGLAVTFNNMAARIQRISAQQQATLQAISHELRTPIARLQFAIELMQNKCTGADEWKHFEEMASDTRELENLVDELLVYARLQQDAPPIERGAFDLAGEISTLADRLAVLSPSIRFHVDGPAPFWCEGSARYLCRAIGNVLRNSQCYAHQLIRIRWTVDQGRYVVTVEDDGSGISAEDRDRVFLPFERLDTGRSRASGGHGLGLAVVQRVMAAHGGCAVIGESGFGGVEVTLAWPV